MVSLNRFKIISYRLGQTWEWVTKAEFKWKLKTGNEYMHSYFKKCSHERWWFSCMPSDSFSLIIKKWSKHKTYFPSISHFLLGLRCWCTWHSGQSASHQTRRCWSAQQHPRHRYDKSTWYDWWSSSSSWSSRGAWIILLLNLLLK